MLLRTLREQYRQTFKASAQSDGVLLLRAGHIAAISTIDVITKTFNESIPCLLKMNLMDAIRDENEQTAS